MKDDLDHYTNTYHIFTKAPDKLEEILACPQVINWEQAFQVQGKWPELEGKAPRFLHSRYGEGDTVPALLLSPGCQESVDEAIRKIAASKSVLVDYKKTKLFTMETPKTPNTSRDHKVDLMELINKPQKDENKK